MAAMTDFLENKILDWLLRGQAIGITGATAAAGTGPANLWVGLFTAAPSDTGGGTEVSGGNYARVQVASSMTNWSGSQGTTTTVASSGSDGTIENNIVITFPTPSASWGLVTHFGIFDAATSGNLLIWSALTQSKTINIGDAVTFPISSLTFQADN